MFVWKLKEYNFLKSVTNLVVFYGVLLFHFTHTGV